MTGQRGHRRTLETCLNPSASIILQVMTCFLLLPLQISPKECPRFYVRVPGALHVHTNIVMAAAPSIGLVLSQNASACWSCRRPPFPPVLRHTPASLDASRSLISVRDVDSSPRTNLSKVQQRADNATSFIGRPGNVPCLSRLMYLEQEYQSDIRARPTKGLEVLDGEQSTCPSLVHLN